MNVDVCLYDVHESDEWRIDVNLGMIFKKKISCFKRQK